MGTEESNTFGIPYELLVPQDETSNRPLQLGPPHWTPSMQANHNYGYTPTSFLNAHAAGSDFCNNLWPNQANDMPLQYDFPHDPRRFSNNPTMAGDAALIFSERVQKIFGENNLDSMKKSDGNLQSKILKTKGSRENGSRSSIPKSDMEGVSTSAASGNNASKGSPDKGHDTNIEFPSTKRQECNIMVGNAISTEQDQEWGTGLNSSAENAKHSKLEEDETRKERKRQSNRESAKRSRIRKQQECEELHKNIDILKDEISKLTHRIMRLSEECLELNNENDSLEEELVKMYGPESIADLMPLKPASGVNPNSS